MGAIKAIGVVFVCKVDALARVGWVLCKCDGVDFVGTVRMSS